jgi:hypothetical protein
MIKFSILPLILLTITIQLKGQEPAKLSVSDLRKDFTILRTTLEEIHPDLYRYTSKQKFNRVADSIFATIGTELTMIDFYRRIAPIVTLIRNGHTAIRLPNSYYDQMSLLPFRLVTFENKVYIRNDFSSQSNDLRGLEIKRINGVSIEDIVKQVIPYISLDGFNDNARFKTAIEDDLSYYYNYKFGESDFYNVELYDDSTDKVMTKRLAGISNKEFLNRYAQTNAFPWALKKLETASAFLQISSFNSVAILDGKRLLFKTFVEEAFEKISRWNVKYLIIDLRNNGGGELKNSILLYSYIADEQFVFTKELEIATMEPPTFIQFTDYKRALKLEPLDSRKVLKKQGNAVYLKDHFSMIDNRPNPKSFQGNLFVLINGQTGSSAGCFAIQVHNNKRGTIVGEENRDNYTGYAAGVPVTLTLPASRINVFIPLRKFTYAYGIDTGRGVIPDYPYNISGKDFFRENDSILSYVLSLAKQNPKP